MEITPNTPETIPNYLKLKTGPLDLEYLTHSPFAEVYPVVFGQSLAFELAPFKEKVPSLLDLAMAAAERGKTFGYGKFIRCPIPTHVTEEDDSPAQKFQMIDMAHINLLPNIVKRLDKEIIGWKDRQNEGTFNKTNPTADNRLMSIHTTNIDPKRVLFSTHYDATGTPSFVDWSNYSREFLVTDPMDSDQFSDTEENNAENILLENLLEMAYLLSDDEE